jgi:hypothetical protein
MAGDDVAQLGCAAIRQRVDDGALHDVRKVLAGKPMPDDLDGDFAAVVVDGSILADFALAAD